MKQRKRTANLLLALLLALVMAMAMILPASAAGPTPLKECKITFLSDSGYDALPMTLSSQDQKRTWKGYKLMNMNRSTTTVCGKVEGTDDHKHTDECYTYHYDVNAPFKKILIDVANANNGWSELENGAAKVDEKNIVDFISKLKEIDKQKFAEQVYDGIKEEIKGNPSVEAEWELARAMVEKAGAGDVTFTVDQGYWLFADVTSAGQGFVKSLVFLDTSGETDITVTPKTDVPTVEKKVSDQENDEFKDNTSVSVGDTVYFEIEGTLPQNLDQYTEYKLIFHDTLSAGLTCCDEDDVKVYVIDGKTETEVKDGVVVGVNDTDHKLTVTLADVKLLKDDTGTKINVTKNVKILVKYHATLNANAVTTGSVGVDNKVVLEYSNRPGTDEIGTTPEDIVKVFTFQLTVNKVDGNRKELKGAGFTLYKKNETKNDYEKVGDELKEPDQTTFEWTGLGKGTYKLEESTVPGGYNKAEDIIFSIDYKAEKDTNGDLKIKEITIKDDQGKVLNNTLIPDVAKAEISTKVVNETGTLLPSTGGMGTILFYVAGSILTVGAVVLLITQKRMRDLSDKE